MAQNTIFSIDAAGDLIRMAPGAPAEEVEIQSLIARFPDMLGDDGDLLTICRKAAIGDAEGATGRWSLDNLFVTRAGVPVLVEVKRASDTRIRREVVGQMLDYAANAVKHWPAGEMARSFAAHCAADDLDPATALAEFLGGDEIDFWDRVDANLKAGKLRLLFVADRIPPELARIVEFLNEQMQAEVLAVELNWFVSEGGGHALVPRLIGATQRAEAQKAKGIAATRRDWTVDEWIASEAQRYGPQAVASAEGFRDFAAAIGGTLSLSTTWISLALPTDDGRRPICFGLSPRGRWAINLTAAAKRPTLSDLADMRGAIERVTAVAGPTSTGKMEGFPGVSPGALLDPQRRSDYLAAMTEFAARFLAAAPRVPTFAPPVIS